MAVLALGRVGARDGHVAAVVAVPGGDLVAPPELAGDAPVVAVLHPVHINFGEALRDELHLAVAHGADGLRRQRLHLHEPLRGDERLHVVVAAVAGADVVAVILGLDQVARRFQVGHDLLAALVAVEPLVLPAVFVDGAVVGDDADDLQIVALAHLEVVGVVGGGHLHRAGAEADLAVLVPDDGDLAPDQRQDAALADEVLKLLVLRVDGHAGVAQHGLRPGGGHGDEAAAVRERIADVPQVAGLVLVLHLRVGKRGEAVGAPVDDAAALVDEALFVEGAEGLAHGPGAHVVHGEAAAGPVAGGAEGLLLLHDAAAVLLLPGPDALQELLAP